MPYNFFQVVVLQVQHFQVGQPVKSLLADRGDLAVVHVEGSDAFSANETLAVHSGQIIAVQSDFCKD